MAYKLELMPQTNSNFIDKIRCALLTTYGEVANLEDEIYAYNIQHLNDQNFQYSDRQISRVYFYLYTVPLLESAGFLAKGHLDKAIFWGRVNLLLCLYTRYTDYIIDNDSTDFKTSQLLKLAVCYLAEAQSLLIDHGFTWTIKQSAILNQLFDYEYEVAQGYFHDFSSLWRRVSPLCILGETYLASSIQVPNFKWLFRNFLSWSLLHSDCDDVLEDLAAERITPVTILVSEYRTGLYTDMSASAETIRLIKLFLAKQSQYLSSKLDNNNPMWLAIISHMNTIFTQDS